MTDSLVKFGDTYMRKRYATKKYTLRKLSVKWQFIKQFSNQYGPMIFMLWNTIDYRDTASNNNIEILDSNNI